MLIVVAISRLGRGGLPPGVHAIPNPNPTPNANATPSPSPSPSPSPIPDPNQECTLSLTLTLALTRALPPGVHGLGRFLSVVLARGLPFVLTCLAGLALTLDLP